ncbi:MAG: EamA family transporter [bacterium]
MDILPLALVCLAAFLHAGWNFLAKKSGEPTAMLWAVLCASLILYAPAFLLRLPQARFAPGAWGFILATGVLHALYFLTLGRAYRAGDLSTVYPLARGSAPLLAAALAAAALREEISARGGLAILLVAAGIYVTHLRGFARGDWLAPLRRWRESGVRWALATGLLTALYSVVDKAGVSRVSPEIYIYLMFILTLLLTAPYSLGGGRAEKILALFRSGPSLLRIGAGGLATMGAYGLVLFAMRMSKVSYVVAAREVSVVLGAALGVFVLKEGGVRQKMAGAAFIAAGIVLLALSR